MSPITFDRVEGEMSSVTMRDADPHRIDIEFESERGYGNEAYNDSDDEDGPHQGGVPCTQQ